MGIVERRSVPETVRAIDPLTNPDYTDAFEVEVRAGPTLPALEWAREIFEKAPGAARGFVVFAWRFALGLRLGPRRSPNHVLGWKIGIATSDRVVLEQRSALLDCRVVVETDRSRVRFCTVIRYRNRYAGLLWTPAAIVHQRIVPYLLAHAARSQAGNRA